MKSGGQGNGSRQKNGGGQMNGGEIRVAFAGNPNCGKTTLFNACTGASLKVANWPGVTVERAEGEIEAAGRRLKLIDLPGIYSLNSYSMEEKLSRRCILEEEIDVIVNVADASLLERNLYLTMQLLELGRPVVLALNLMDVVQKRGMRIDLPRLSRMLGGIPVIPVSARKRTGLAELMEAVVRCGERKDAGTAVLRPKLRQKGGEGTDAGRYAYIEKIVGECVSGGEGRELLTEKIDGVLTHRIWGIAAFLAIMACVFALTFTVGDFLKGYFEQALSWLTGQARGLLERAGTADWLVSLIVDGIIAGVGGVLAFLPNISILFLAMAFLEDSGYMARVAYVMDSIMAHAGLSGKAFLPMLLGFGCTVPAVMAARALESEEDRKRTILLIPFMSCSAKLPVYLLFAEMFFPDAALAAAYSLYLLGLGAALALARIWSRVFPAKEEHALLIELPDYRLPDAGTAAAYVWNKVKDYLDKAGTTIFMASVILWFVLHYGPAGTAADMSQSFGAAAGRLLAPLLAPAGLGTWRIALALISGLSAKEVVISSFSVLFGVENVSSAAGRSALAGALANAGFGPANACALLVFCLFYTPCVAALAAIHRETHSWRQTLGMAIFQLLFAWIAAAIVFQAGSRLF